MAWSYRRGPCQWQGLIRLDLSKRLSDPGEGF